MFHAPRPRPMTSPQPTSITRDQARELVDSFARGWSKAQVDTILSTFTSDAVFIETPFADPLQGSESIRKYWSDVPYHQAEIPVPTGEIFSAGGGACPFEVGRDRPVTRQATRITLLAALSLLGTPGPDLPTAQASEAAGAPVRLWMNRDRVYREGEPVRLQVDTDVDGYLLVP